MKIVRQLAKKKEYERKCYQETGKCLYCDIGKRGDNCTEDCNIGCNLTIINCEQDDGKCKCKDGYYGEICDGICDPNCEICNENDGICSKCKSSYYVDPDDKKLCKKFPEIEAVVFIDCALPLWGQGSAEVK